jgi:hypothetical protein
MAKVVILGEDDDDDRGMAWCRCKAQGGPKNRECGCTELKPKSQLGARWRGWICDKCQMDGHEWF